MDRGLLRPCPCALGPAGLTRLPALFSSFLYGLFRRADKPFNSVPFDGPSYSLRPCVSPAMSSCPQTGSELKPGSDSICHSPPPIHASGTGTWLRPTCFTEILSRGHQWTPGVKLHPGTVVFTFSDPPGVSPVLRLPRRGLWISRPLSTWRGGSDPAQSLSP